jgi:hypothetical protein
VVDALLEAYATSPGVMTIVQVRVLGGAAGDIPVDATAFGHRGSPFLVFALAASASREGVDACRVWADGLLDRLGAHATGAYSNFLEHEGEARVRSAFPEATYRRLALAKARWDPDNVFHLNANIVPARPEPSL